MEAVIEKECSALGGLFQTIISDMKSSYPVWEDFITKAGRLHSQLRATVTAAATFLDAFQKVADLATSSRGATRDIGSALTRICMRQRSVEARLRQLSAAFTDCLINPLQEQMEEWKKGLNVLDKDHARDYKKARQEIKKRSSDTLKLHKKAKKGKGPLQPQLCSAMQDMSDKYLLLEDTEKQALRRALVEERGRFCAFVSMLRPVMEEEISMLAEITHLQAITDDLKVLTMDPHKLPPSGEQVILDLKGWSYPSPPSSPSSPSRKSSICSSLNSVSSSDSHSSSVRSRSPPAQGRYRGCALTLQPPGRLSSISSHDSGFVSQHAFQTSSPSPLSRDAVAQLSSGLSHHGPSDPPHHLESGHPQPFPHFQHAPPSSSSSSSWVQTSQTHPPLHPAYSPYCTLGNVMIPSSRVPSWKDWAKPGPYDQPMVNTLKKKKQSSEQGDLGKPVSQSMRAVSRVVPGSSTAREDTEADGDLSSGLPLPPSPPASSQGSLHGSSGYSSHSATPSCSEDTIPSQDSGYFSMGGEREVDGQSLEKSSSVPCYSELGHSYRRMLEVCRPASAPGPVIITPGVATIRRTPSTKPSVRRTPIPLKTSVIPVRTPSVPDQPGEGGRPLSPVSPVTPVTPITPMTPMTPVTNKASWKRQVSVSHFGWDGQISKCPTALLGGAELSGARGDDMLVAIRRGVCLKKTVTNDRSAPHIA